jgi:hypothetical protein
MRLSCLLKTSIVIAAALQVSIFAPGAMAASLSLTIVNPDRLSFPGGTETFQGTIANNTGFALDSTDLFVDFSGYDPAQVTLDQLLGSTSFTIADGTTSSLVDLFTFSLANTAAVPATYPADVVLEDLAGDLSTPQAVSLSTVPEPSNLALMAGGFLALLLGGAGRRMKVLLPVVGTAILCTTLRAQVSAVQMITTGPGVTQAGSGQPVQVTLPLENSGTVTASNVRVTNATLRAAPLLSPSSFPVSLGTLAPRHSAVFQASFGDTALVPGTPYLLTVRGTYTVGGQTAGFAVNRFIEISQGGAHLAPPKPLPPPPTGGKGCYVNTRNGWQKIPCATDAFINSHFPHPDTQLTLSSAAVTAPLTFGQLAVTIPQVGSENNAFLASTASTAGCTSSGSAVANQWSIQSNTNAWAVGGGSVSAGDIAATQFVIQSDGSDSAICVWNVDVSTQDYSHRSCVTPSPKQRAGGLQAFDSGNIQATVNADGTLSMVAELSWVPAGQPNQYAVNFDDTYGLAANWSEVSGGILGMGNCSQAQLTNAEVITQTVASTCAGDTQLSSKVCAPPLLQPNATTFIGAIGTVETNNLTAVGSPSVGYLNSDLALSNITATTTGSCLGPSHAYVQDSPEDFGGTPSNIGNQVWWESPDIFLVPTGTPVSLTSISTETTLVPGGTFDIYVRVHNDLGCAAITGTKTLVYLADPAALSVEWSPITGAEYVGDSLSSTGVTVPAGGQALIGPLTFTAPSTGIGNGHKCLLAAIEADGEGPPANSTDAMGSNQVAQRNVQFVAPCAYPLTNGTNSGGNVQITLSITPNTGSAPSLTSIPNAHVTFDDADSSWYNVWSAQAGSGSTFAVFHSAATKSTTVTLGAFSVALDAVPLGASQTRNAMGVIQPVDGGTLTLQIGATLTDSMGNVLVSNGGSCTATQPVIIVR